MKIGSNRKKRNEKKSILIETDEINQSARRRGHFSNHFDYFEMKQKKQRERESQMESTWRECDVSKWCMLFGLDWIASIFFSFLTDSTSSFVWWAYQIFHHILWLLCFLFIERNLFIMPIVGIPYCQWSRFSFYLAVIWNGWWWSGDKISTMDGFFFSACWDFKQIVTLNVYLSLYITYTHTYCIICV